MNRRFYRLATLVMFPFMVIGLDISLLLQKNNIGPLYVDFIPLCIFLVVGALIGIDFYHELQKSSGQAISPKAKLIGTITLGMLIGCFVPLFFSKNEITQYTGSLIGCMVGGVIGALLAFWKMNSSEL